MWTVKAKRPGANGVEYTGELLYMHAGDEDFDPEQIGSQLYYAAQREPAFATDGSSWPMFAENRTASQMAVLLARSASISLDRVNRLVIVQGGQAVGAAELQRQRYFSENLCYADGSSLRPSATLGYELRFWVATLEDCLPAAVLACANACLDSPILTEWSDPVAYCHVPDETDIPEESGLPPLVTNTQRYIGNRFLKVLCDARVEPASSSEDH